MRKIFARTRDVPAGTPCWEIPTDALAACGKTPRRTESGGARGWQGAKSEHIRRYVNDEQRSPGAMHRRSNAVGFCHRLLGRETGRRLLVQADDRPLRVVPRRQPWWRGRRPVRSAQASGDIRWDSPYSRIAARLNRFVQERWPGQHPPVRTDESRFLAHINAVRQFHRSEDGSTRRIHAVLRSSFILQHRGESLPVGVPLLGRMDRNTLADMGPLRAILKLFAILHDGPGPWLLHG